jgi:hypothetical protein
LSEACRHRPTFRHETTNNILVLFAVSRYRRPSMTYLINYRPHDIANLPARLPRGWQLSRQFVCRTRPVQGIGNPRALRQPRRVCGPSDAILREVHAASGSVAVPSPRISSDSTGERISEALRRRTVMLYCSMDRAALRRASSLTTKGLPDSHPNASVECQLPTTACRGTFRPGPSRFVLIAFTLEVPFWEMNSGVDTSSLSYWEGFSADADRSVHGAT